MLTARSWVLGCVLLVCSVVPYAYAQDVITMWVHSGPGSEREAYVASIKAFNESQTAYRAELITLPEGQYEKRVEEAAKSNQLPCVLDFDGPFVYNYIATKKIVPLDDIPDSVALGVDMLPSLLRQGTYKKRLYSVGQYDSGLAIWANRKLLNSAGVRIPVRLTEAWSLSEFEEVLRKLKDSGVPYPLDMKFNYGLGEWMTYGISPIVQSMGGDLINRNGFVSAQGAINGPAAVAALTAVQGWVKAGYVNPTPKGDDDFIKGRSALSYVGHWTYREYKKALGNDLVLIPMPRFGHRQVTGAGSWNFGISANCQNRRGAAKLLTHLMKPDEITRVTAINGAIPGTFTALMRNHAFDYGGPLHIYYQQLSEGVAEVRPETAAYPAITAAFSRAVGRIVYGADVKRSLDTAAETIDRFIAQNPSGAEQ